MALWAGISGGLQSRGAPVLGNASNSRLVIFDENKNQSAGSSGPAPDPWAAPPTSRAKENEQKAERWCDVKVGQYDVFKSKYFSVGKTAYLYFYINHRCNKKQNLDIQLWLLRLQNQPFNHLLRSQLSLR